MKKTKFIYCAVSVLILSFLLFSCQKDNSKSSEVLARVGDEVISASEFQKRFQKIKVKMGLPDNGETRRGLLKNMVSEKLLVLEAKRRGYDRDAKGQFERERIRIQGLLNIFYTEEISKKVKITEAELRELFVRFNTRIKARHLYAPTRRKADSLYQALMNGASFQELAKQVFKDPKLRESGGLIGYFTVDEMDPNFEDAAFKLKVGEISPPVRTSTGYSIIKVEDRISTPILTEYQFAKKREQLEAFLRYRKTIRKSAEFVDSMRQALHVRFNTPVLEEVFQALKGKDAEEFLQREQQIPEELPAKNEVLVYSDLGNWTVEKFQQAARYTGTTEKKWIRNTENLEDFIAGLVVRQYMLDYARKKRFDKKSEYAEFVKNTWESFLIERVENAIWEEIEVPEDSLKNYYRKYVDRFVDPPRIGLREIVVSNKQMATKIEKWLKAGARFSELAEKYSIRSFGPQKAGEIGYFTQRELGSLGETIFSMEVGDWKGPFRQDSLFVFLQCFDKLPGQQLAFEEARPQVVKTLKYMWYDKKRKEVIQQLQRSVKVKNYPEKLIALRLN